MTHLLFSENFANCIASISSSCFLRCHKFGHFLYTDLLIGWYYVYTRPWNILHLHSIKRFWTQLKNESPYRQQSIQNHHFCSFFNAIAIRIEKIRNSFFSNLSPEILVYVKYHAIKPWKMLLSKLCVNLSYQHNHKLNIVYIFHTSVFLWHIRMVDEVFGSNLETI